jgi:hypothetical protein
MAFRARDDFTEPMRRLREQLEVDRARDGVLVDGAFLARETLQDFVETRGAERVRRAPCAYCGATVRGERCGNCGAPVGAEEGR